MGFKPVASPAALRHHPRQEPRALTRMRGSVRGDWRKPVPYRDEALRMRMHLGEHEVAIWLGRVIRGWLNYYAVPGTSRTLANFVQTIKRKCCAFCADACRKIATVGQHWTALQASIGLNPPSVTCGLASGLSSTPEVGAGCVNAHARICAGGLGQPSFLQR